MGICGVKEIMKCPQCKMEMEFQGKSIIWLRLYDKTKKLKEYGFGEIEEEALKNIIERRWYCLECEEIVPFIDK